jgi:HNH endonuclease
MEKVTLCACGCGEPAVWAASHKMLMPRVKLTAANYVVQDCGYSTPCWIYKNRGKQRPLTTYNTTRVGGRQIYAHRAMYEQEVGPIPKGLVLDHLCRIPACIRPDHLEAVTSGVNTGRGRLGKLDAETVRAIRYEKGNLSARFLAELFGVNQSLIYMIWSRKIWKDI